MATIIKNRQLAQDNWQRLEPASDGALPSVPHEGDVIVPLALWQRERSDLRVRKGRVGVWLQSNEEPEALVADIRKFFRAL